MEPHQHHPQNLTCHVCGKIGFQPAGLARHKPGISKVCVNLQLENQKRNLTAALPSSQTAAPSRSAFPVHTLVQEDLPSKLHRLRQSCRLLRRIPKAARFAVAESLVEVLDFCLDQNNAHAWSSLLTFSYTAFSLPDLREQRKESLATHVKKNLSRPAVPATTGSPRKPSKRVEISIRKAVERKMEDGDVSGAVRILTSEDAVAPPTADVLDILRTKHPTGNPESFYPPKPSFTESVFENVTAEEIVQSINSFPNGSAGGIDGLRPQHLKDLLAASTGEITTRLSIRLAAVINLMLQGKIPEEICPLLYGACLTALKKKDGGMRPIAVGSTLRRLAGKIVSRRVMESMGDLLRPTQLGYGTRGGAEVVVHATRSFMSNTKETQVLLKLDFKNAFNTISRDKMLWEVREHIPQYYSFVWQMYRNSSKLQFGEFSLLSQSGAQQGCPLGPLLFCLTIRNLSSSLHSPLNAWYLDDGTIGGSAECVIRDLEVIIAKGEEIGLELNLAKCEAYVYGGDYFSKEIAHVRLASISPDMKFPSTLELSLLGAPILPEGIAGALEEKTSAIRRLTRQLEKLQAHQALFILKNCLSTPKVIYILRSSPAWLRPEKLRDFDGMIRESLANIANTDMTEKVWQQATLPVGKGGLGIRRTEELALSAYLASVYSVQHVILTIVPDADMNDITAEPTSKWCEITGQQAPLQAVRKMQKTWDSPMTDMTLSEILDADNLRDKARVKAAATKESGCWLNAIPIPSLGNLLDDSTLRISIALRLGAEVCRPHKCQCGGQVDLYGHHGLSCKRSAGRSSRHSSLNEVLKRALVSAGVQAIREPPGLEREGGLQPDGMTLVPWKQGKALIWDVTCVDTMAASHIVGSITSVGSVADEAEKKKIRKYEKLAEGRFIFCPLGFETFGSWGPGAKNLIGTIGRKITDRTGEKRAFEYLRQRFSIEIQRGNACCILGTHVFSRGLDEVFYLLTAKRR
jgi:hypothetical protein